MMDHNHASDGNGQAKGSTRPQPKDERVENRQVLGEENPEGKEVNKEPNHLMLDLTDLPELEADLHRSAFAVGRKGT